MKRIYLILWFLFQAYFSYPQKEAGADRSICKGASVKIGTRDEGHCYVWNATPGLTELRKSDPIVNPTKTTTYKLTIVGKDFSFNGKDEVVISVVENDAFPLSKVKVTGGAVPSIPIINRPKYWGLTRTENIEVAITVCTDGSNWRAILIAIQGNYSSQVRLLPGAEEVTGPQGNTTRANFCDQQLKDLFSFSLKEIKWYMLDAIRAHENVHISFLEPSLKNAASGIESLIETISVPDIGQTQEEAISQIKASDDLRIKLLMAKNLWNAAWVELDPLDESDPNLPQYDAEFRAVANMIIKICDYAKANNWGPCALCE